MAKKRDFNFSREDVSEILGFAILNNILTRDAADLAVRFMMGLIDMIDLNYGSLSHTINSKQYYLIQAAMGFDDVYTNSWLRSESRYMGFVNEVRRRYNSANP